jgi:hypothetical protein
MRIHVSRHGPVSEIRDRAEDLDIDSKPRGLWWANGAAWVDWCLGENQDYMLAEHVYRLDLGPATRLVSLADADGLRLFSKRYGRGWSGDELSGEWWDATQIDWPAVAQDYDGIDLRVLTAWGQPRPDGTQMGRTLPWISGIRSWDVPSGCIWRPCPETRLHPLPPSMVKRWLNRGGEGERTKRVPRL